LLMDEPLGALDKKLREHMQLEIKQITQSLNITTIYVTHDQSESMTMSDRIAVMNKGRIEQVGSPTEMYDSPSNYFVADFIGESNFMVGQVEAVEDDGCYFMTDGGVRCRVSPKPEKAARERGHLVIRPEKVSLAQPGQSFDNQFDVIIEEALYLGDITVYWSRFIDGGATLTIKQQNRFRDSRIKKGDKLSIGWSEKDNCIV